MLGSVVFRPTTLGDPLLPDHERILVVVSPGVPRVHPSRVYSVTLVDYESTQKAEVGRRSSPLESKGRTQTFERCK